MKIMIIANFVGQIPRTNNRFNDISRRFAARGAEVEVVTSDFFHSAKRHHIEPFIDPAYTLTRVHEPGYKRNISIRRLRSQRIFAMNVRNYLNSLEHAPDILYVAVPPPSVGKVAAEYATKHGITFVVDIQDLWPEAFDMATKGVPLLSKLLAPMRRASRDVYRVADLVVAVSKSYASHAESYVGSRLKTHVAYLGTKFYDFERKDSSILETPTNRPHKVAYIGTLGHSYDLPVVIDALALIQSRKSGLPSIEFVVLGDGPLRSRFESYAQEAGVKASFLGKVSHSEMARYLHSCDLAVNPIVKGSAGSVLNKVADYAAAGLPVVNTQESKEYRQLLHDYGAGMNCGVGDRKSVAEAIEFILGHPDERAKLSAGSYRMGRELFDRNLSYEALIDAVVEVWDGEPPR